MNEEILLTQEGYDKIVKEHEYLISVRRAEVSEHLKEAKSHGDLSENAEYDAAKDEQAELEERISKLEFMIRTGKIISESELTGEHVNLGLTVKIQDIESKEVLTFMLVGATEAEPFEGKISNESPIGKALLGKSVGEVVDVLTQSGHIRYEIKEIYR